MEIIVKKEELSDLLNYLNVYDYFEMHTDYFYFGKKENNFYFSKKVKIYDIFSKGNDFNLFNCILTENNIYKALPDYFNASIIYYNKEY